MNDLTEHAITVRPEPGVTPTWQSLTRPPTEPGTAFRPACSCGWAAELTHDTEEGARRAGEAHAAVNSPREPGRYVMDFEDGWITLRCNDCRKTVGGWQGSGDYAANDKAATDAITAHQEARHG